ncbi:MAG TPA: tail fiber domain-containing protein [Polyangiaceae bacterium]|nr:tail fiber domain-containing protein [Polyangiaceae bacterium]
MRALLGCIGAILGLFAVASDCGGSTFSQTLGGPDASTGGSGTGSGGGATSGASTGGSTGSASGSQSGGRSGSTSGATSGSGAGSSTGSSAGGTSGAGTGSSAGATSGGSSGSGATSGGGSGSSSGGAGCDASCGAGRSCCSDKCVNPTNDPLNCGSCGKKCDSGTYCTGGSCRAIPCVADASSCSNGATCCGTSCCAGGQLCCELEGPVQALYPTCYTPTASQPTCPQGCSPLCVSDRNVKRDIEPADDDAILEGISRLPVSTWSYTSDDPSVRHLGPMAQDFHAAFGLGNTDKAYDAIDAHGVAFSAIRALARRLAEEDARIKELERENRELRTRASCGGR